MGDDNSELVVVAAFTSVHEAQFARSLLESAGLEATLADEHVVSMDWFYSNAIGGVKVLVPRHQLEEARALLDSDAMAADPFNLQRFIDAQESVYERALTEIRAGRKQSHWMWFIFPQYAGLGSSPTSRQYAIKSVDEATAYLEHPVLGARLIECAQAVLAIEKRSAADIFGHPDDLKLRSSATLFAAVSDPGSVFEQLLRKMFGGAPDEVTLSLISAE